MEDVVRIIMALLLMGDSQGVFSPFRHCISRCTYCSWQRGCDKARTCCGGSQSSEARIENLQDSHGRYRGPMDYVVRTSGRLQCYDHRPSWSISRRSFQEVQSTLLSENRVAFGGPASMCAILHYPAFLCGTVKF